jgi:hypothetical protein
MLNDQPMRRPSMIPALSPAADGTAEDKNPTAFALAA